MPAKTGYENNIIPYIISIEANFAFVITLIGGMAGIPRVTKKEGAGYLAGVFGQGLSGSFFVVVGAVMAIAMQYVTGEMTDDPTLMLAVLSAPIVALSSLLLVAASNIGTQAVGSYIYGIMLKSSFRKTPYNVLILVLAAYVILLSIWGKIIDYFGSLLTISACVYAPLAALLFVDFFIIRRQKLDLRSYGM
jgi:NCS1 family nucleobase:cation symporter-1